MARTFNPPGEDPRLSAARKEFLQAREDYDAGKIDEYDLQSAKRSFDRVRDELAGLSTATAPSKDLTEAEVKAQGDYQKSVEAARGLTSEQKATAARLGTSVEESQAPSEDTSSPDTIAESPEDIEDVYRPELSGRSSQFEPYVPEDSVSDLSEQDAVFGNRLEDVSSEIDPEAKEALNVFLNPYSNKRVAKAAITALTGDADYADRATSFQSPDTKFTKNIWDTQLRTGIAVSKRAQASFESWLEAADKFLPGSNAKQGLERIKSNVAQRKYDVNPRYQKEHDDALADVTARGIPLQDSYEHVSKTRAAALKGFKYDRYRESKNIGFEKLDGPVDPEQLGKKYHDDVSAIARYHNAKAALDAAQGSGHRQDVKKEYLRARLRFVQNVLQKPVASHLSDVANDFLNGGDLSANHEAILEGHVSTHLNNHADEIIEKSKTDLAAAKNKWNMTRAMYDGKSLTPDEREEYKAAAKSYRDAEDTHALNTGKASAVRRLAGRIQELSVLQRTNVSPLIEKTDPFTKERILIRNTRYISPISDPKEAVTEAGNNNDINLNTVQVPVPGFVRAAGYLKPGQKYPAGTLEVAQGAEDFLQPLIEGNDTYKALQIRNARIADRVQGSVGPQSEMDELLGRPGGSGETAGHAVPIKNSRTGKLIGFSPRRWGAKFLGDIGYAKPRNVGYLTGKPVTEPAKKIISDLGTMIDRQDIPELGDQGRKLRDNDNWETIDLSKLNEKTPGATSYPELDTLLNFKNKDYTDSYFADKMGNAPHPNPDRAARGETIPYVDDETGELRKDLEGFDDRAKEVGRHMQDIQQYVANAIGGKVKETGRVNAKGKPIKSGSRRAFPNITPEQIDDLKVALRHISRHAGALQTSYVDPETGRKEQSTSGICEYPGCNKATFGPYGCSEGHIYDPPDRLNEEYKDSANEEQSLGINYPKTTEGRAQANQRIQELIQERSKHEATLGSMRKLADRYAFGHQVTGEYDPTIGGKPVKWIQHTAESGMGARHKCDVCTELPDGVSPQEAHQRVREAMVGTPSNPGPVSKISDIDKEIENHQTWLSKYSTERGDKIKLSPGQAKRLLVGERGQPQPESSLIQVATADGGTKWQLPTEMGALKHQQYTRVLDELATLHPDHDIARANKLLGEWSRTAAYHEGQENEIHDRENERIRTSTDALRSLRPKEWDSLSDEDKNSWLKSNPEAKGHEDILAEAYDTKLKATNRAQLSRSKVDYLKGAIDEAVAKRPENLQRVLDEEEASRNADFLAGRGAPRVQQIEDAEGNVTHVLARPTRITTSEPPVGMRGTVDTTSTPIPSGYTRAVGRLTTAAKEVSRQGAQAQAPTRQFLASQRQRQEDLETHARWLESVTRSNPLGNAPLRSALDTRPGIYPVGRSRVYETPEEAKANSLESSIDTSPKALEERRKLAEAGGSVTLDTTPSGERPGYTAWSTARTDKFDKAPTESGVSFHDPGATVQELINAHKAALESHSKQYEEHKEAYEAGTTTPTVKIIEGERGVVAHKNPLSGQTAVTTRDANMKPVHEHFAEAGPIEGLLSSQDYKSEQPKTPADVLRATRSAGSEPRISQKETDQATATWRKISEQPHLLSARDAQTNEPLYDISTPEGQKEIESHNLKGGIGGGATITQIAAGSPAHRSVINHHLREINRLQGLVETGGKRYVAEPSIAAHTTPESARSEIARIAETTPPVRTRQIRERFTGPSTESQARFREKFGPAAQTMAVAGMSPEESARPAALEAVTRLGGASISPGSGRAASLQSAIEQARQ